MNDEVKNPSQDETSENSSIQDGPVVDSSSALPLLERGSRRSWLWYTLPVLILAFTASGFYYFELSPQTRTADKAPQVELGQDYYVLVSLVELAERNDEGELWDEYPPSAPDIRVEIIWKDQTVYASETKSDTLIAKWSNAQVDLLDLALKGERASVDSAIRAARINIAQDDTIEIRVYDADILGASELAGSKQMKTSKLRVGEEQFSYQTGAIRRLKLRVLSMDRPPDILQ